MKNKAITFLTIVIIIESLLIIFVDVSVVSGASMLPTLNEHAYALETKTNNIEVGKIYAISNAKKYGFKSNGIIKRVIAGPGDTIEIINGRPIVNGAAINEPYALYQEGWDHVLCIPEITLGEDEYYIMGDNRDYSADSRTNGPVKAKDFKKIILYYQLDNNKFVDIDNV